VVPAGIRRRQSHPSPAHAIHPASRAVRPRICEIRLNQWRWRFPPVHARKEQSRRALQHSERRPAKQIRKSHRYHFLPPPDSQHKARIRIEFHSEARRPALAAKPREHPLKKRPPSRNKTISIFVQSHSRNLRSSVFSCQFLVREDWFVFGSFSCGRQPNHLTSQKTAKKQINSAAENLLTCKTVKQGSFFSY
jgi:hypothetical protein